MSLISKIQSLISSANVVTGESRTDLTSAVQDLKDGYGGSAVEKGLVFSEYDSDGYPHKAEFVGTWTEIPSNYANSLLFSWGRNITLRIPATVTRVGVNAFSYCGNTGATAVIYEGNPPIIEQNTFSNSPKITLYDFSHATSVPTLYSVNSLGHANGCVIKVPQSLLSTWQNETNWSALTNVVWQGV